MPQICKPIYRVQFEMNFQNTGQSVPGARSEYQYEPPHLHCKHGKHEFKLFLETWKTEPSNLHGKKGETKAIKYALNDLKPYREELLKMWKSKKVYVIDVETTRKRACID